MDLTHRLYRSNQDRMLAGVAGGIAKYFAIDRCCGLWWRSATRVIPKSTSSSNPTTLPPGSVAPPPRALRPILEAKAEAWRLATSETELPNAIVEAIIGGFYHPAQHALTEPFVERYFATVGEVWAQRTGEIARAVAVGLYPDTISDNAVAAADAFLADSSLPPALRRLVSEGRDDVQRALRAHHRDAAAPGQRETMGRRDHIGPLSMGEP